MQIVFIIDILFQFKTDLIVIITNLEYLLSRHTISPISFKCL